MQEFQAAENRDDAGIPQEYLAHMLSGDGVPRARRSGTGPGSRGATGLQPQEPLLRSGGCALQIPGAAHAEPGWRAAVRGLRRHGRGGDRGHPQPQGSGPGCRRGGALRHGPQPGRDPAVCVQPGGEQRGGRGAGHHAGRTDLPGGRRPPPARYQPGRSLSFRSESWHQYSLHRRPGIRSGGKGADYRRPPSDWL